MTSSLRQILVHLDSSAGARQRLALARALAARHEATLSALYAATPLLVAMPASPESAAAVLQIDVDRRARVRGMFDETLRSPGPPASWGECAGFQADRGFARQALYADLLVLGQHDPSDGDVGALPADFPEAMLMASGRPAMIVPHDGCPAGVGDSVAIAWKPTREAARAVAAAMPILRRAAQVHVLCWDDEEEAAADVRGTHLDLDSYLRLHGVQATWQHGGPEPQQLGEILLSRVFDAGADLLVMGCYGHGRAREWMLGGTSRTILRGMTVPVLMAH